MKANKNTQRRNWTAEERQLLQTMYPDHYVQQISQLLNRSQQSVFGQATKLGLKKSEAFKKMELERQGELLKKSGANTRYQKGMVALNKGKAMSQEQYEKCKATMFKKGQKAHNALNQWEEVIRTYSSGAQYYMIKLTNEIKLKHIWLWESKYGPVAKDFNVVFKDGNTLNCTIENLECISDVELMKRNTLHRFPEELKTTIRLFNKLKRAINAKEQN